MKHLFSALALGIWAHLALAQSPSPGFVITPMGDSLSGYIMFSPLATLQTGCEFSPDISGPFTPYTPASAIRFGFIGGRVFKAHHYPADSRQTIQFQFLELLTEGVLELLRSSEHLYLRAPGKDTLDILNTEERKVANSSGSQSLEIKPLYINTLRYLMRDCPDIVDQLSVPVPALRLSMREIKKLLKSYHACIDKPYRDIRSNQPFLSVKLSLRGKLVREGHVQGSQGGNPFQDDNTPFVPANFGTYQYGAGSLASDWYFTRRGDKAFVRLGFEVQPVIGAQTIESIVEMNGRNFRQFTSFQFQYWAFRVPIGVGYRWAENRFQPSLVLAVGPSFLAQWDALATPTSTALNDNFLLTDPAYVPAHRPSMIHAVIETEWRFFKGKLGILVQIARERGPFPFYTTSYTSTRLGLSYHIF